MKPKRQKSGMTKFPAKPRGKCGLFPQYEYRKCESDMLCKGLILKGQIVQQEVEHPKPLTLVPKIRYYSPRNQNHIVSKISEDKISTKTSRKCGKCS